MFGLGLSQYNWFAHVGFSSIGVSFTVTNITCLRLIAVMGKA